MLLSLFVMHLLTGTARQTHQCFMRNSGLSEGSVSVATLRVHMFGGLEATWLPLHATKIHQFHDTYFYPKR